MHILRRTRQGSGHAEGAYKDRRGFTLLELLISMAILSILYGISFGNVLGIFDKVYTTKMKSELGGLMKTIQRYSVEHGGRWPADAEPGVLPAGLEEYMIVHGGWPEAPWEGSVYDWENFVDGNGKPVYQVSTRFCPDKANPTVGCNFPKSDWAEGWTSFHNSYYICIQGNCTASGDPSIVADGFCMNCQE